MTRRYKAGFSPEELTRGPIKATCGKCGGDLLIFPAGNSCRACSPPGMERFLMIRLDRMRVANGWMPASELVEEVRE